MGSSNEAVQWKHVINQLISEYNFGILKHVIFIVVLSECVCLKRVSYRTLLVGKPICGYGYGY